MVNIQRFRCLGVVMLIIGGSSVYFTSRTKSLNIFPKPLITQPAIRDISVTHLPNSQMVIAGTNDAPYVLEKGTNDTTDVLEKSKDEHDETLIGTYYTDFKHSDRARDNETDLSLFGREDNFTMFGQSYQSGKSLNQTKIRRHQNYVLDEKRHVAFLKVHKAASTTLQNIFFRFGYDRNLSFVFPVEGHYVSSSTSNYKKLIPPLNGNHYDIICNHAFFNYTVYSKIMPKDTIYISVIRDPFQQFISAYYYYTHVYHLGYLMKIAGDQIRNLIYYPEKYDRKLSYTMNSMARDFGFLESHYDDRKNMAAKTYLKQLGSIFDLVLIAEYMDESLILMKRLLNWSLKDILYISLNVHSPEVESSEELQKVFRQRNWLDYLVYHYFYKRFLKKMDEAGNNIHDEIRNFKELKIKVQTWCDDQYFGVLNVNRTVWNVPFTVTSRDCKLMAKKELRFIKFLKDGK